MSTHIAEYKYISEWVDLWRTAQFSPGTKWAHLLLVPFLELTRRFPKGSLRRILSGSERERFAVPIFVRCNVAIVFTQLALSCKRGTSDHCAAAGRGALAARRDMATQHDDWTPPVDGAPAVAGAPSRTLCSRGASPLCIVRSTAGWATYLERWRGRQGAGARLRDRRAERSLQHARASHVLHLATIVARPAGEQASTVIPPPPRCRWWQKHFVTQKLERSFLITRERSRKPKHSPPHKSGFRTSTDESTQEQGQRATVPI